MASAHADDPQSSKTTAKLKDSGAEDRPSRYEKANVCSRWTFSWLNGLIGRARRGRLSAEHVDLGRPEQSHNAHAAFDVYWQEEVQNKEPSLFRALRRAFWPQFVISGVYKFFWGAFVLLAAYYFVNVIVGYLQTRVADYWWVPWVWCVAFFLACVLLSMALQQMSAHATVVGVRARAALMTAVYAKAVHLGSEQRVSEVIALVAGDCSRVMEGAQSIHYLWSGPIESLAIVGLLIGLTGLSGLVSLGLVALLIPVQLLVARAMSTNRVKSGAATETRVQVMHEILLAIKLVKFYAWEASFAAKVADVRRQELRFMQHASVLKSVNLMLVFLIPPLLALGIFAVFVMAAGGTLTAAIAFTTLSLFNTLRFPLIMLPRAIRSFVEARSAIQRLQAFLLQKELSEQVRGPPSDLVITQADIAYGSADDSPVVLHDIDFSVKQGELLGMVGPVGSGKTTLLNCILGESRVVKGSVQVGGRVAYVPQNPWVQHGTVRDNIIFGLEYDEKRYNVAVEAAALLDDFKLFQNGDLMELGERGINVSGGQKQRIAFARALYAQSDVYLLDSVLSAVDQLTCTHMFERGLKKALRGKTVVLVTHQLELLRRCDRVCIMRDCKVAYLGPYKPKLIAEHFPDLAGAEPERPSELKQRQVRLETAALLASPNAHAADEEERDLLLALATAPPREESSTEQELSPLVATLNAHSTSVLGAEDDSQMEGDPYATVMSTVYRTSRGSDQDSIRAELGLPKRQRELPSPMRLYLKRGGALLWGISFFIVALTQAVRIASDQFIKDWVAFTYPISNEWYLIGYAIFTATFGVLLMLRGVVFYRVALRASTVLHNALFERIVAAPIAFFTTTPMGPLLNSFSKDQDSVDQNLPDAFHMSLVYLAILLTTIAIVCIQVPYYAIAIAVVLLLFVLVQWLAGPALGMLKTLHGDSSGPVFAHVSESLHGIAVVRSFDATDRFRLRLAELIDRNHAALFNLICMNLWTSFYLDLLGALLVFGTALYVVGDTSLRASSGGLAISNTIQLLVFFSLLVRDFNDIQTEVHAVKRIESYVHRTAAERQVAQPLALPAGWPSAGQIEYSHVVMRYFPFFPRVLNNVSFTITGGHKVGVCGRTGSGKTTLIVALFRLVELSHGKILIDGVDISQCALREMRGRLSIIPQEPMLFSGTIRSNLDPFDEWSDDQLWRALELSGLRKAISALPDQLEARVAANGDNFSLGQKQLFCVARAVLRDSMVLVLDEATSAMDLETDQFIQRVVRTTFAARTVITIAHRLDTIIDSDRILVMDKGRVAEYDSVPALLALKSRSIFYQLVTESGLDVKAIVRAHKRKEAGGEDADKALAEAKDKSRKLGSKGSKSRHSSPNASKERKHSKDRVKDKEKEKKKEKAKEKEAEEEEVVVDEGVEEPVTITRDQAKGVVEGKAHR